MEQCEHFRSLILTDYIDGELDKKSAESMEGHLLGCSDCRVLFKEVKNKALVPFQQAVHQAVPPELWDAVKQNIERADQSTNHLSDLVNRLKGLMVLPRLAPVFASLMLMLIAGVFTLNTIQVRQAKENDQAEYLVSLLSTTGSTAPSDNNDWGTSIERYFL